MKEWLGNFVGSIRQLRYPADFRITPPVLGDLLESLQKAIRLLEASSRDSTGGQTGRETGQEVEQVLCGVATRLWRIRQKVTGYGGEGVSPELRAISLAAESAWDALEEGGIEIKDHTGEFLTGGEALRIIAFQPMPGLVREQVIETLRPTVYYQGMMIQMGEVIVGKPEKEGS